MIGGRENFLEREDFRLARDRMVLLGVRETKSAEPVSRAH